MSDFHDTVAKVHAGGCPLCGRDLSGRIDKQYGDWSVESFRNCPVCDVGWRIGGVHDRARDGETEIGMGPMLVTSRDLTPNERRRLYDRSASG